MILICCDIGTVKIVKILSQKPRWASRPVRHVYPPSRCAEKACTSCIGGSLKKQELWLEHREVAGA